jgi:hypothetical protein
MDADIFINVPHMEEYGTFIAPEDVQLLIQYGYREAKSVLAKFKKDNPELWTQIAIDDPLPLDHPSIAIDFNAMQSVLMRLRSRSMAVWKLALWTGAIAVAGYVYRDRLVSLFHATKSTVRSVVQNGVDWRGWFGWSASSAATATTTAAAGGSTSATTSSA